jgi:hypothetical protein
MFTKARVEAVFVLFPQPKRLHNGFGVITGFSLEILLQALKVNLNGLGL